MGVPVYGHFDAFGIQYIVGDAANGSLDDYNYTLCHGCPPYGYFKYHYSVTDGLYASETPEAAAYIRPERCEHCDW